MKAEGDSPASILVETMTVAEARELIANLRRLRRECRQLTWPEREAIEAMINATAADWAKWEEIVDRARVVLQNHCFDLVGRKSKPRRRGQP